MNGRIASLKLLVERSEKCRATHSASTVVRLKYPEERQMVWEGVVETFDLHDHPDGLRRAYAWEQPPEGPEEKPEYKVVLGKPPINSPEDAVNAWIVSVYRNL